MTKINQLIQTDRLIANRRYLHAHPELSFEEVNTANFVNDIASQYDTLVVERPTKTSLVITFDSQKPGKTLALRADMDALPIQESLDLDFASQTANIMHACGHDAHTAMLLETLQITMKELSEHLTGKIKFIFQHAEEVFPGGAKGIVDSHLLDDVDLIFGLHVNATSPVGQVGFRSGVVTAASDKFQIDIQGIGTHAAEPEKGIDPIIIGSQIVQALQTIPSRRLAAKDSTVVSVGKFIAEAGTAINIIPDTAILAGSVRTTNPTSRQKVHDLLTTIATQTAQMNGGSAQTTYDFGYASIVNDPAATLILEETAKKLLPAEDVQELEPMMVSEDFSAYTDKFSGSFAMIGAGMPNPADIYPHHHPKFQINEDALPVGVALELGLIIETLGSHALKATYEL